MSCLDVMYQVYGPPQPYFAAAYSPYRQVRAGGSAKKQALVQCNRGIAPRCLKNSSPSLIASHAVPAHFETALRKQPLSWQGQASSEVLGERLGQGGLDGCAHCCLSFLSRSLHPDGSFPMSQRSFPPSFWNSTYQPSSVPATLSSPLAAAAHSELPFAAAADPYAPASLHGHLHQGGPEPWHHAHHHHHHHHHPYIGTQSTAYPRPTAMHEVYGPHFDPRYGSLLVPTTSVRPHRLTPASVPTHGTEP
ncbi:VGLL2 protein, partial [Sula dactylatra]|nr:VGLL2 protein [Sula dactylatra]